LIVASAGEVRPITKDRMLGYAIANPAYDTESNLSQDSRHGKESPQEDEG
jgi:hypothetical protein